MTKIQIGKLLTSLCAISALTLGAHAEDKKNATSDTQMGDGGLCQNNTCKGNSECMGHGNANCSGQNSCKGHGWVNAKDAAECKAKNGIWHGKSGTPSKSNAKDEKPQKKG